jgi:ferrochelatase
VAEDLGASYYRPEMPNAHADLIDAMTTIILKRLAD